MSLTQANSLNQQEEKEEIPKENNQNLFFSIIEKLGSFGPYQKITIIFWCLIIFFCGQLLFSTPFLFYQDPYACDNLQPTINCKDFVCSLQQKQRSQYIPTIASVNSLANELGDYRCSSRKGTLDSIIAVMFFGIALGYLLLTLFGQLVSKKILMIINFGCYVLGIGIVLIFYKSEIVVGGALMIAVLGISNCYIICFMFLIETVESKAREKYTTLIQSLYGIGAAVNILLYWLINSWKIIFFACYFIPAIALLILMWIFLVDTPMSLILRNPPQKALKQLQSIAKLNKSQGKILIKDIIQAGESYKQSLKGKTIKKITVIEIFRYKSTRYLTILLILLQCTISFSFYAPSLMLSSFHFNIFINGLSVSLSQVVANFSASLVVSKFKRRLISICCFGCAFACSFTLIFVWDQNEDQVNSNDEIIKNLVILALIFLFQFSITKQYSIFYVYQNEVFPTQARMIAVSTISLMGGLMTTFTSKVIGFCLQNKFPVMIIFTGLTAICIVIMIYLPETFKNIPKQMIDQIQNDKQHDYFEKQSETTMRPLVKQ